MKNLLAAILSLVVAASFTSPALAAGQFAGKVVALRGKASIERQGVSINAKVQSPLEESDAFRTGLASRAKLLFSDDSVLTLNENTRISINEFIHQKGKEGRSVFNLIDGKMRAIVGKTRFEVRTPTAVAAARGTIIYFEVGRLDNQDFSKIICLEGKVVVRSSFPSIPGEVILTRGNMITVTANKPLPSPVQAPQSVIDNAAENDNPQPPPKPPVPPIPPVIQNNPPGSNQPGKGGTRINPPDPGR